MSNKTYLECVGDVCNNVQVVAGHVLSAGAELAGAGLAASTGDYTEAMKQVKGAGSAIIAARRGSEYLKTDLVLVDAALQHAEGLMARIERSRFKVCGVASVRTIVDAVKVRVLEIENENKVMRNMDPESYRTELGRDLMLLATAITELGVAALETQLHVMDLRSQGKSHKQIVQLLKSSC
jgi:hypothetical protein